MSDDRTEAVARPAASGANEDGAAGSPLDERHVAELRASAIPVELAIEAGIYSTEGDDTRKILGWQPRAHRWGRGIVYPFRDLDGKTNGV